MGLPYEKWARKGRQGLEEIKVEGKEDKEERKGHAGRGIKTEQNGGQRQEQREKR